MLKSARQESLRQLISVRGSVTIAEAAEALGVSPATARRDVLALEKHGHVTRTWGGAQVLAPVDDPFQEALHRQGDAKQRIAARAADLVEDGATVILDIGTTVHYVALALTGRSIAVMTPSLPAFEHLRRHTGIRLTLLGGHWSEAYQCFDGSPVTDALEHQQADIAFLGCSGVSAAGRVRDTSSSQSMIKRAMVRAASSAWLLADASKFPGQGGSSPFTLSRLDGVITDLPASHGSHPDLRTACTAGGTTMLQV